VRKAARRLLHLALLLRQAEVHAVPRLPAPGAQRAAATR
jgi:hypothetical protein